MTVALSASSLFLYLVFVTIYHKNSYSQTQMVRNVTSNLQHT